jgi:MFS family permease
VPAAERPARTGRIVVVIGIALALMFVGDAATTNWGGLMLQNELSANKYLIPAGLFTYLAFQFLGRSVADRIIGRIGAVATVVVGAVMTAGGFATVATARVPAAALVGFALVGLGLSVVVPLTFSAADALDPAGSGVVIARVNLFNYAGVIIGSTVVGVVSGAVGLRYAFAVPGVLVLLIVVLAPAFRVVDAARAEAARTLSARAMAAL